MAEIDRYFQSLVSVGGSDLHLAQGQPAKIRLHGAIHPLDEPPLDEEKTKGLLQEIADPKGWENFEKLGDLDFAYEMDENSRFRCNFYKQQNGYGAVFRLIPTKILTLDDLGIPKVVQDFGNIREGLVLVTGPTGSGKSTTLAALIDYINTKYNKHIITVEEPIEFVHNNKKSIITQREVGIHTKSFADGLRAALREDTNIVLVGEMRDLDTVSLALTAAETGMLVFGTLHTNNAQKTVDRLIDVFPASQQAQVRTMLAGSLRGIVAQLLLKTSDGAGRVAVNEILVSNPAVSAVIREGATHKLTDIIISGKSSGMQFMDDDIWSKMLHGRVTPLEAYMKAIDKSRFKSALPPELSSLANAGGGD